MISRKVLIRNACNCSTCEQLRAILKGHFHCDVRAAQNNRTALSMRDWRPDLIISIENEQSIEEMLGREPDNPTLPRILVYCVHSNSSNSKPVIFPDDYAEVILTPLNESEVLFRLRRLLPQKGSNDDKAVRDSLLKTLSMRGMVGRAPRFLDVVNRVPLLANCDVPLLITGETGSGKEVCARSIHYLSGRSDKPFIPVDCGAIPANLLENELFGHQHGAYTDARTKQRGIVAEANGGTLFLDEIDMLSLQSQCKLLRLLEENSYRPLGSPRYLKANVRIIAATNADLPERVEQKSFRKDLFYRLSFVLEVPPLRERKSDVPLLAEYFLSKLVHQNSQVKIFSTGAIGKLLCYDWPGNVRELHNVIQQAFFFARSRCIKPIDIDFQDRSVEPADVTNQSFSESKRLAIEKFEKEYVTSLLSEADGNISKASRMARKDRRDFGRLVRKHNIDPQAFRGEYEYAS